jgi:hypothetical protein
MFSPHFGRLAAIRDRIISNFEKLSMGFLADGNGAELNKLGKRNTLRRTSIEFFVSFQVRVFSTVTR